MKLEAICILCFKWRGGMVWYNIKGCDETHKQATVFVWTLMPENIIVESEGIEPFVVAEHQGSGEVEK